MVTPLHGEWVFIIDLRRYCIGIVFFLSSCVTSLPHAPLPLLFPFPFFLFLFSSLAPTYSVDRLEDMAIWAHDKQRSSEEECRAHNPNAVRSKRTAANLWGVIFAHT